MESSSSSASAAAAPKKKEVIDTYLPSSEITDEMLTDAIRPVHKTTQHLFVRDKMEANPEMTVEEASELYKRLAKNSREIGNHYKAERIRLKGEYDLILARWIKLNPQAEQAYQVSMVKHRNNREARKQSNKPKLTTLVYTKKDPLPASAASAPTAPIATMAHHCRVVIQKCCPSCQVEVQSVESQPLQPPPLSVTHTKRKHDAAMARILRTKWEAHKEAQAQRAAKPKPADGEEDDEDDEEEEEEEVDEEVHRQSLWPDGGGDDE
jgi:hypothetical protein